MLSNHPNYYVCKREVYSNNFNIIFYKKQVLISHSNFLCGGCYFEKSFLKVCLLCDFVWILVKNGCFIRVYCVFRYLHLSISSTKIYVFYTMDVSLGICNKLCICSYYTHSHTLQRPQISISEVVCKTIIIARRICEQKSF